MQRLANHVLVTAVSFVVIAFVIALTPNITTLDNHASDDKDTLLYTDIEVEYKLARDKEIETGVVLKRKNPPKTDVLSNGRANYSSAMTVIDELPSVFKKSRLI